MEPLPGNDWDLMLVSVEGNAVRIPPGRKSCYVSAGKKPLIVHAGDQSIEVPSGEAAYWDGETLRLV